MIKKSNSKRQEGILTLDFIFSTVVVYSISMVFMFMALTLMFSSVSQYVLFSSARAKSSAHIDLSQQERMAEAKFQELVVTKLGSFFGEGKYFELRQTNFHIDEEDTVDPLRGRRFYGTSALFVSKILDFRVPMLGNTSDGLESDEFSSNMSAFIYREPTTTECLNFNSERWEVLFNQFRELQRGNFNINSGESFGAEADNGC